MDKELKKCKTLESLATVFIDKTLDRNNVRTTKNKRPQRFRCSGLPVCSLKVLIDRIEHGYYTTDEDSLSLDIYAGTGTHLHTVMQKWTARLGLTFGQWEQDKTITKDIEGKKYQRVINKVYDPEVAPKEVDGLECTYKEFIVHLPTIRELDLGMPKEKAVEGFEQGHTDGLIPFKDGYVVIDYKFVGHDKVQSDDPVELAYEHQINAYMYLLSKYGPFDVRTKKFFKPLKIYGGIIFYISRDAPFGKKFEDGTKEEGVKAYIFDEIDEEKFLRSVKSYKRGVKAYRTGDYSKAVAGRLCKTEEEKEIYGCDRYVFGCTCKTDEKIIKGLKD